MARNTITWEEVNNRRDDIDEKTGPGNKVKENK
jgi:hypothetical protein